VLQLPFVMCSAVRCRALVHAGSRRSSAPLGVAATGKSKSALVR
jgi:hypothetical protein